MLHFQLFGSRRVPFVAAQNMDECGLACLAAISAHHKGETGIRELRSQANNAGHGNTLLELRDIAERMGLSTRALSLKVELLQSVAVPAILHWDMNHFVVLERVRRDGIVIMDPAVGRVQVPWAQVRSSFTGVALEATPSNSWQRRTQAPTRVSVLRFIGPWSRWKHDAVLIALLSLLMEVLTLAMPLQMQLSIDQTIASGDGQLVWVLGISFMLLALIHASMAIVRSWSATVLGTRIGFELMDRFMRALHRKPARFFLTHHTADILSRGRSVDAIQNIVTAQFVQALLDLLMSLAMLAVMFAAVPSMALLVALFGLANVGVIVWLRGTAVDVSRRSLRAAARADALFLENARAARAIRLFGKENVRIGVWRNRFVEKTNLLLEDGRLLIFARQAGQITASLGNVALISAGTYLVVRGSITLGTMLMFVVLRSFFVERLNNCANYLVDFRRVQTHAERIDEVIGDEGEPGEESPVEAFSPVSGQGLSIELRDVWFRYGNAAPWILRGVSLRVAPGESLAVTGASGCGKTTLLHLMLGLLTPDKGEILVNGRDLRTISSAEYARLIGVVLQDDILFQGSVAENIAFFDAPADMERIERVAQQAHIAADIQAMPMRYYSPMAEGASNISGGQKQRLFIARALYHGPRVLFLDEATSHLDAYSERLVGQAIASMHITRILIAHRQETIASADRVLVLDNGQCAPARDRPARDQPA